MFGVGRDFNPIAGSQEELIAGNIKKKLSGDNHPNFMKGMSMLGNFSLRRKSLFKGFETFGFEHLFDERLRGRQRRLPASNNQGGLLT